MTTRLELSLACGERLEVHRFSVQEGVSSLFAVQVTARSPDPCLDLRAVVGAPAAVRLVAARRSGRFLERRWSGVCSRARAVQAVEIGQGEVGLSTYELTLVPSLWLLGQRTNHRVYQHLSAPEIVQSLLAEWGIVPTWHVAAGEHPRLPYKVQYGETDLDFASRLLEEAGIAYRFADEEDEEEAPGLVLSDALHASAPRRSPPIQHVESPTDAPDEDHVTRVSVEEELRTARVVIRDHDFERPGWRLEGESPPAADGHAAHEHHAYRPGAFLVEHGGDGAAYRASHADGHGAALARRALEAARAGRTTISFETNAADLRPGTVVFIEGHPRLDQLADAGQLVTSLHVEGTPHGISPIRGTAVPAAEPFRPAHRTRKPRVHGVQSAVVVGPPGEEIHTDTHGRVKVQFPWDREAQGDDRSSCWLRVSQGWAGAGLGIFALPRVGQEVLVAFLDGDPDQPIVMGRVPNALNPSPIRLPEERTQSVWRSASTPGGAGYNEIRFEDRQGGERVTVRAQRELSTRAEGRALVYVGEDSHMSVEGERRERTGGKQSLTVEGELHEAVAGLAAREAAVIHLRAAGAVVIEGGNVTLRGPGGFVRIDAGGVTIDGGAVRIQQGGAPGAGPGADPSLPLVPLRSDQGSPRPRVRLPLFFEFPSIPRKDWPHYGEPLNGHERFVCTIICWCKDTVFPQSCTTRRLKELDQASGGKSLYKAEVRYDMSKTPPEPIMSKNEPWRPSGGNPKGNRSPDVVVVKDPAKPPTQDNIEEVLEIKFRRDEHLRDDALGFVRFGCPLVQPPDISYSFPEALLDLCRALRPISGYAGIGVIQSPDSVDAQRWEPAVYELAQRFLGLEAEFSISHAIWLVKGRDGKDGIKGVNWLTVVADRYLDELGGAAAVRQAVAALDARFIVHSYEGGVMIQAGERPALGDVEREAWPELYVKLAKYLKPIRITQHRPFGHGGNGWAFGKEEAEAWLRRFDER